MYCPSCGHQIESEQRFCKECGHSLADAPEQLKIRSSPEPPIEFARPQTSDDATTEIPAGVPDDLLATSELATPDPETFDTFPDASNLPTPGSAPPLVIPELDWATPTGDLPSVPIDSAGTSDGVAGAVPAPPPPSSGTPPPPPPPATGITSTDQMPVQAGPESTATMTAVPGGYPAVFDGSGDIHEYPTGRDPFKLKLVFVLAIFGAIGVLMAAVADIIDIRTSAPVDGIATGIRTLDTLGTNLAVAGFFGATVMVIGGLLACFGFRWGAGLAGGAGLALTGWAAMIAGLAELRVASAESITRQTTDVAFTLTVTRDLGFWLTVAVGVIGVLVFIASLRSFGTGGRPPLNPWIGALGAVAGVVLVAGPLLPEGNATFANNFRSATTTLDLPTAYFAGRLVQLGLIGFAVVFGLLIVRAYGLGLAAGGVSVAFWMWLSSLLDLGTFPVGVAAGNFGAVDSTPHAVTSVGMALTIFMLVVAAILAAVGSHRQRQRGY